jgi:hypothetical protein
MRTLTDEEKQRLMDELIESIKMRCTKLPYEMTKEEFAEKSNMSAGFTKKFLSEQVQQGKMAKRKIVIDGKTFVVYSVI